MPTAELKLTNGLNFPELRKEQSLRQLDERFLTEVRRREPELHDRLLAYRADVKSLTPLQISELLLACAPYLERFIAELFGIQTEAEQVRAQTLTHDPVFVFKKQFVQKRAKRRLSKKDEYETFDQLDTWLTQAIYQAGTDERDRELAVARYSQTLLTDETTHQEAIENLTRWCARAQTDSEGRSAVRDWVSFRLPQPADPTKLVPVVPVESDAAGRFQGPPQTLRQRDGFKLTDERFNERETLSEVNYCIYCHDHDGDFCSKGFPEKKGQPDKGIKVNPLGVTLTGCPLDEKISEMHLLKRDGYAIAALAMIMVDNPMCPVTGHRICNDCMKSCIYQKQDPVNIPQIETRCLTDVLALPWGVEIYDLLTRWNPLRARQYLAKPYNGLKVLIVGMGPAGFTLAHHLLMEGFAVVGTEGLKIEPLPRELIDKPIRNYADLEEELDTRVMTGFGGVAEYGITVRWDKNFLRLIYLSLLRRPRFQVFGGVRFGGTITVEEAWTLGFDHVTVAVGAGLPQALPVPGSLAPGMRQANDFLMALQLTGAAKASSLANLQVRLPAVVIGGGLTAVDTATEVQAYYIVQVEKTLDRHEKLVETHGESHIYDILDEESREILEEYLLHGRAVRTERQRALTAGEAPDFVSLIRQWGGVTIAYRRALAESPAYIRNHEEITKAFEEGIYYAEGLAPKAALLDRFGHVDAMAFRKQTPDDSGRWQPTDDELVLPARSIFVATGARPNVAYEFEHHGYFAKEHGHYQTHHQPDGALGPVPVASHCKEPDFGAFTSYTHDEKRVSFIGDTHPVFHGSVVKAVASGLRTYPKIVETLGERVHARGDETEYLGFRRRMEEMLRVRVERVVRLDASMIELTIRAPLAARRCKPGQFFRLQNYETQTPVVEGVGLTTEALALTAAGIDPETGTVSLLVQELGASSRLCATLKPGDPVSLMGPAGVRTKIPDEPSTVMIVTDRLGLAHVRAVGPAMRAKGHRVLYIACLKHAAELVCQDELERAADTVVWCTENGEPVSPRRPQDRSITATVEEALKQYADGKLELNGGQPSVLLQDVDRLLIVGTNALVRRMRDTRWQDLQGYFCKNPKTIGSISAPMQCMLKGVCSQCLQWQIDPETGHRTKAVFGCSWQDQPLDIVDLDNLDERLSQNRLQERLANLWLDYLFSRQDVARV